MESSGAEIKPPCQQCVNARQVCYGKTRGPGCWRCSQRKIGCSIVEARKKGKGKETEVIRVKRVEKRCEDTELGEIKDILKKMVKVMERMADGIEGLAEGQEELIDQQRSTGLGVEKLLRVIEEKDRKREEEREREREEKRKTEEAVEDEEKTDSESETEETAAGEKDGDGDVDEAQPSASA